MGTSGSGIAAGQGSQSAFRVIALIPLGIGLNLALGTAMHALKLPVFLDAVGTIAVTILAGFRAGAAVGVLSFLIGGALVNPVLPWFCGTQVAIAGYTHVVAAYGMFRTFARTVLTGIGLGVVAAIASAPVIVYVFGGVTGSGESLVTAFLLRSGHQLVQSVVLAGISCEPIDKTLQCVLAVWLLRGVPKSLLRLFPGRHLGRNKFNPEALA